MEKLSQIWRRLRFFFRHGQMDHDLAEEMQLHLELKEEEKKAAGFDEEEARLAARREFGNPMLLREASREMWGWTTIESILQDLRYGLRMLLKNPGFSFVAILTLALGIGANSAIFSVVDGFFLRSLPVKNPNELVWIKAQRQGQSHEISYLDYQDICRQSTAFSGIAAVSGHGAMLNMGGETELVRADWVSENHFSFLGLNAALGRTFVAGEDWSQYKTPPVVISTGLWKRRFGADPGIIGKTVILNNRDALILGVAPRWFTGLLQGVVTEVWFPCIAWTSGKDLQSRGKTDYWELLGRLNPGIREEKARAELDTIAYRLAEVSPSTNKGINFLVETESERARDKLMLPFFLLCGTGLVLIICCANVSGMMLAQAAARQREIVVRLALGSGRRRLVRQLLTESLLLAGLGATISLLLTVWLFKLQPAMMPPGPFIMNFDFRVDARVLVFTLGVSMFTAIMSGLAPAFRAARTDLSSTLKGKGMVNKRRKWWPGTRNLFVVGQVALSLTMVVTAGLFLKSLLLSEQINPGFDTSKKLLIVNLAPTIKPQAFYSPVIERIGALPGVKRVSYAMRMLLSGTGGGLSCEVSIPGVEPQAGHKGFIVKFNSVGRDYFQTVGCGILRGRPFDTREESGQQRSVIINEAMAKRFWSDPEVIGKYITVEGNHCQIVGLVQDGKINNVHQTPEAYLYFPFTQYPRGEASILVETTGDPGQLAGAVKQEIRTIDKGVNFYSVQTLKELMGAALWEDRMAFLLTVALGILGTFLTAIGLYGVVAYLAKKGTPEIGIRLALGAQRRDVYKLVLGQGMRLAGAGILVGLGLAGVLMKVISSAIYGVESNNTVIFLGSASLVLSVALLASFIPARRAAQVDPLVALREE